MVMTLAFQVAISASSIDSVLGGGRSVEQIPQTVDAVAIGSGGDNCQPPSRPAWRS